MHRKSLTQRYIPRQNPETQTIRTFSTCPSLSFLDPLFSNVHRSQVFLLKFSLGMYQKHDCLLNRRDS
jgi:hypothetical protein